jgi:hypothetical protein
MFPMAGEADHLLADRPAARRATAMTEEEALIRSFIVKEKRQRLVDLLANPKRRKKVTSSLSHFGDLDPRWMIPIPRNQQHPPDIERLLRARGAGDTCYAISEASALDGKHFLLEPLSEKWSATEWGRSYRAFRACWRSSREKALPRGAYLSAVQPNYSIMDAGGGNGRR